MHLETKRLVLRPLRPEDVPALARLWTDAVVTRFMGGPRQYDEVAATLLEDSRSASPPPYDLDVLVHKASEEVIGHCGIIDKEIDGVTEYELTYVLAASAWGRGYATEIARAIRDDATGRLGLHRIVALIEPANAASKRVAEKTGLRYEKNVVRPDGQTKKLFVFTPAIP